MVHGIHCPKSCGIDPDQGSNLLPLQWQVESSPLDDQGSPQQFFKQHGLIIETWFEMSLYFYFPVMKLISADQIQFTIQNLVFLSAYSGPGNLLNTLF